MQRSLTLSCLALALSLHAGESMALGFGRVTGTTGLGQPLDFAVTVRLDVDDAIEPGCVSADVVVGDRALTPDSVRTRLVRIGSSGERRIRVTTTVPIDEPSLSVTVRAGCPARLTRSFVVFADPPHTLARTSAFDAEEGDDTQTERPRNSFRADIVDGVRPAPTRRAAADGAASRPRDLPRVTVAARPSAVPEAVDGRPAAASPRAPARAAPTLPARSARPTLQLDPIEEEVNSVPTLRMATDLGTAPAASGAVAAPTDPELVERRREQDRLRSLESALQQLRDDTSRREAAVVALEAQLRRAETQRAEAPSDRLVQALAALSVLLGVALIALWMLRRRDRAQAEWLAAVAVDVQPDPDVLVDTPPRVEPDALLSPPPPPLHVDEPPPPRAAPPAPVEAPRVYDEVYPILRGAPLRDGPSDEPRRPMSAEELIDLEQQVEFFVVLGQDDAAIDLLMGHVRSTSGVSPLPYVKLLEIYGRRGEHEAHERIRERFNRRFNAYAPEWGVDVEAGRSVDGYPEVLERLQGIWEMPSMAMELLDTLLFRRDAGPTFDVPAYRELLFLYGVARDLAERDIPASGVDLLLPFGDTEDAPSISPVAASSESSPDEPAFDRLTLDLDVSTDQPPTLTVEDPPMYDPDRGLDFRVEGDDSGMGKLPKSGS